MAMFVQKLYKRQEFSGRDVFDSTSCLFRIELDKTLNARHLISAILCCFAYEDDCVLRMQGKQSP